MDAVITYVDGLDPKWQEDYKCTVGGDLRAKRFRDWGTLKYLLRGIQTYMPFIRNVYLVVARESQVPEWVNRENLKVILHSDIIPERFLPTFNSTAIELYLHKIPGLDEEFVYFNDDFFPVKPCSPEDFFVSGKAVVKFHVCKRADSLFKRHCANSDAVARAAALTFGPLPSFSPASPRFIRPQHICTSMYRSHSEKVFELEKDVLEASVSTIRQEKNINQYLYSDYLYYRGLTDSKGISCKHFSLAVAPAFVIRHFILHPDRQFACINDVSMGEKKYRRIRQAILGAFEEALPQPSRYEV